MLETQFARQHTNSSLSTRREFSPSVKQKLIDDCEVGLTSAIIRAGYRIVSLQRWAGGFDPSMCRKRCQLNPTLFMQDPFELIFIKYGGMTFSQQDPCKHNLVNLSGAIAASSGQLLLDRWSRAGLDVCCAARRYEPILELDEDDSAESILDGARKLLERRAAGEAAMPMRRILVSYVYSDKPTVRTNLEYFLSVALRDPEPAGTSILFALIVNGWKCPVALKPHLGRRFLAFFRSNRGFDYGGHGAFLRKLGMSEQWPATRLNFTHFIWLNSGVRGPFLPQWTPSNWHWSQAFTDLLGTRPTGSERVVHLVGTSITCLSPEDECVVQDPQCAGPKVEGFMTATDAIGVEILRRSTVFQEHETKTDAILRGEYMMSRSVLEAGHNLASLQLAYKGVDWTDRANWHCNSHQFAARSGKYFGGSMHPFETLFHKAHWETGVPAAEANVLADEMERYSLWLRAAGEGQGAQVSGARRQDEARMPSNATGSGTTTCSMGSAPRGREGPSRPVRGARRTLDVLQGHRPQSRRHRQSGVAQAGDGEGDGKGDGEGDGNQVQPVSCAS